MKCIILCAGYATRMFPLTENFPKPLLNIKNHTIIDYLISDLNTNCNIVDFYIVTNNKYYEHFAKWKKSRSENIILLDDGSTSNENRLGAVKDFELAVKQIDEQDDVIVLAGDNLLDFSLHNFVKFSNDTDSNCIMFYEEFNINKLKKTGVVQLDKYDIVIKFDEKPKKPQSRFAVPPFYIFRKHSIEQIIGSIFELENFDSPGMLLERLVNKIEIRAYKMNGNRVDVGNLEDYDRLK